jgi:hypothetical protein
MNPKDQAKIEQYRQNLAQRIDEAKGQGDVRTVAALTIQLDDFNRLFPVRPDAANA